MSHFELVVFSIVLVLLILMSAFFSGAETALISLNRYRLRHKARIGNKSAIRILKLLERPDRLLGMILIGNTLANIMASAIATLLAVEIFGPKGVVFSTILLTIVVLIFSEVAPKTLAVIKSDRVSQLSAWPIRILLFLFYPLVWLINGFSNGLLRIFGIKMRGSVAEPLSREELRSLVYETTGRTSAQYQTMLLGILDLNKILVEEVMVPRDEIIGIDLEDDWDTIESKLRKTEHDRIPVYQEHINNVVGILHTREFLHLSLAEPDVNKHLLKSILHEPYFIPEATTLNTQLLNFQREKKRLALVVDEYGEIHGLVTVEDILEEIVGEFTTNLTANSKLIELQPDGSYLVDGTVTLREFNRETEWKLPSKGPRTLNGLIIEYLEAIPREGVCVLIANYPIEIVEVKGNNVKIAKISPRLYKIT